MAIISKSTLLNVGVATIMLSAATSYGSARLTEDLEAFRAASRASSPIVATYESTFADFVRTQGQIKSINPDYPNIPAVISPTLKEKYQTLEKCVGELKQLKRTPEVAGYLSQIEDKVVGASIAGGLSQGFFFTGLVSFVAAYFVNEKKKKSD